MKKIALKKQNILNEFQCFISLESFGIVCEALEQELR
jgi:hypothetical protein